MTPHEKELLQKFLNELNNTSVQQKDSDAYTLITESAKKQPDALYLLVQRSMGLEMALQVAQKQMAELRSNSSAAKPASSFLSDNNAWGRQGIPAGAATKRLGLWNVGCNCNNSDRRSSGVYAISGYTKHDGATKA
ncbi:MAG: hypothetical protein RLZZ149_293 [Pseudomonadota bacterium]